VNPLTENIYGNRVRTRVCGLCRKDKKLLLVNHHGVYGHDFWAPPGGGVEFGVSAEANLIREFLEETGLAVKVGAFRFACEFIQPPLHAVELFFDVTAVHGKLSTGHDPEMGEHSQVISDVRFLSLAEIDELPEKHKHGLFRLAKTAGKVSGLKGYLKI
jgi:8-oxo-dGTP diphosphatase